MRERIDESLSFSSIAWKVSEAESVSTCRTERDIRLIVRFLLIWKRKFVEEKKLWERKIVREKKLWKKKSCKREKKWCSFTRFVELHSIEDRKVNSVFIKHFISKISCSFLSKKLAENFRSRRLEEWKNIVFVFDGNYLTGSHQFELCLWQAHRINFFFLKSQHKSGMIKSKLVNWQGRNTCEKASNIMQITHIVITCS